MGSELRGAISRVHRAERKRRAAARMTQMRTRDRRSPRLGLCWMLGLDAWCQRVPIALSGRTAKRLDLEEPEVTLQRGGRFKK